MRISIYFQCFVVRNLLLFCHVACVCQCERIWRSSNTLFYIAIASHHIFCTTGSEHRKKLNILFYAVVLATLLNGSNVRVALNLILMWTYVWVRMQITSFSLNSNDAHDMLVDRFLFAHFDAATAPAKGANEKCTRETQLYNYRMVFEIFEVRTVGRWWWSDAGDALHMAHIRPHSCSGNWGGFHAFLGKRSVTSIINFPFAIFFLSSDSWKGLVPRMVRIRIV